MVVDGGLIVDDFSDDYTAVTSRSLLAELESIVSVGNREKDVRGIIKLMRGIEDNLRVNGDLFLPFLPRAYDIITEALDRLDDLQRDEVPEDKLSQYELALWKNSAEITRLLSRETNDSQWLYHYFNDTLSTAESALERGDLETVMHRYDFAGGAARRLFNFYGKVEDAKQWQFCKLKSARLKKEFDFHDAKLDYLQAATAAKEVAILQRGESIQTARDIYKEAFDAEGNMFTDDEARRMAEDIHTIDSLAVGDSLIAAPQRKLTGAIKTKSNYYEFTISIPKLHYSAVIQTDSKLLADLYRASDGLLLQAEITRLYDHDVAFWEKEKPELLSQNKEHFLDSAIIKSLQNIVFEYYKTENALATFTLESSGLSNDIHATIYKVMRRKIKNSLPLFDDVTAEIAGYLQHLDGFRILINDNQMQ